MPDLAASLFVPSSLGPSFCRWSGGLVLAGLATLALAAPRLECRLEHGGAQYAVSATPVADPYTVAAQPVGERFRFKAVMVGEGSRVDYVKLYAYYQGARQPVLLQQTEYRAPAVTSGQDPMALTGRQRLYSPDLERELTYGCALVEGVA